MKKFEGILLCTDLDGTLLRSDKSISLENKEAIEYFKNEGGLFTFITGRMPYYSSTAYEAIEPNAPFGCINGAGLYDHRTGEYAWHAEDLGESVKTLIECAEKGAKGIGIQVCTYTKTYFSSDNDATENFRNRTGLPHLQKNYKDVNEPIAKIIFSDYSEENISKVENCLKSHPLSEQFDFIRSEQTLYEILPKGISKGSVLLKMAEVLGIEMARTVAVGDYNNDVSMISIAGAGIAVSNATDAVKEVAKYTTVSNEEHAIAKIISDIENGKIKI